MDAVAEFPVTVTPAAAATVTEVTDAVAELPVTLIVLLVMRETEPTAEVPTFPLALTAALPVTVTLAVDTVAEFPEAETPAAAVTVTELTDAVDPGNASSALPQVLSSQAILLEFQPCHATFALATLSTHYAILMMALLASAAGNVIVKSPAVEVLSPPKARTTTARFALPPVVDEL